MHQYKVPFLNSTYILHRVFLCSAFVEQQDEFYMRLEKLCVFVARQLKEKNTGTLSLTGILSRKCLYGPNLEPELR